MNKVNPKDMKDFDNPYKIALIAMKDGPDDLHMCLVSSLCNKGDDKMMFGEFVRGISKKLIYDDPRTGFLIMSVSRDFWTGSMDFRCFGLTRISAFQKCTTPICMRYRNAKR